MKMLTRLVVIAFVGVLVFSLATTGCTKDEPSPPPNNTNDNDTTITENGDTTQPDSTGMGTITLVNTLETAESPSYFAYNDSLLIYASSYIIKIMSLSSPAEPVEISQFPTDYPYTSMIKDIVLKNSILIIALDYPAKKLVFVDVSDPQTPQQIGELTLTFTPQCIDASNNYVFVGYGDFSNGQIIDYSEPTSPEVEASIPCAFSSVAYANNYLYCISSFGTVTRVDLSDITNPTVAQLANTGRQNLDVAVTPWGHLYIACGVETGTNTGGFTAYYVDELGVAAYDEELAGYAAKNVDYDNNFVYLLLRPAPSGSDYLLRTYFAYHLEQITAVSDQSIPYGTCVAALNHYIYVGARSGSGGNIYVYYHEY